MRLPALSLIPIIEHLNSLGTVISSFYLFFHSISTKQILFMFNFCRHFEGTNEEREESEWGKTGSSVVGSLDSTLRKGRGRWKYPHLSLTSKNRHINEHITPSPHKHTKKCKVEKLNKTLNFSQTQLVFSV